MVLGRLNIGQLEIDLDGLRNFLVKAKKDDYAGSEKEEVTLPDGSKRIIFHQGRLFYTNICIGHIQFFGTETVEFDTNSSSSEPRIPGTSPKWVPIWKMNYRGRIRHEFQKDAPLVKETYEFLRQALSKVQPHAPFRGPFEFFSQDHHLKYSYDLGSWGDLIDFAGKEIIDLNNKGIVYHGDYHGGIILP